MNRLVLIAIVLMSLSFGAVAQKKNVKIEYKKYEKFDLGSLEVDGEVISPGDISIDNKTDLYDFQFFRRKNFRDENILFLQMN